MKDLLIQLVAVLFAITLLIGCGYIAIYLGAVLPYQLWINGEWGFAIAQVVIAWTWLLGGNRK